MLGSLYRKLPGKRAQSAELLKRVTTMRPDDIEAWIELAELQEGTDPAKALQGLPDKSAHLMGPRRWWPQGLTPSRHRATVHGRTTRSLRGRLGLAPHGDHHGGAARAGEQRRCAAPPPGYLDCPACGRARPRTLRRSLGIGGAGRRRPGRAGIRQLHQGRRALPAGAGQHPAGSGHRCRRGSRPYRVGVPVQRDRWR